MISSFLAMIVLVLAMTAVQDDDIKMAAVQTDDTKLANPEMVVLGKRFLESIKNENIIAFAHCWASQDEIITAIESIEIVSDERRQAMDLYYLKRDHILAAYFNSIFSIY